MQPGLRIGPYTVERELGRGGMGAVYLGRLSPTSEPVAIKVIHADLSFDEDLTARFEREGAALERLSHPNLVALRGRGIYRGGRWLAMDFVAGSSLAERLKSKGPWPSHAARELMISLCAGIEHAHQAGILHRDLKPDNVLLRAQDGQALIADFGLALPLDVSQHLTQTGEILGSPGYLAPEQCGLPIPTSAATDVYGLGALLYTVLTGQPPVSGASLLGMLDNVLNAPPVPPSLLVENLDPSLEAICLRCLAKEPSERYPSVSDLRAALGTELPTPARRGGVPWLGLGLVSLAGLAGLAWALGTPEPPPASPASPSATPSPSVAISPQPASTAPLPSSSQTPASKDPTPRASFEEALAKRDWKQARALLAGKTGVEGSWQAYRLLAAELAWTGEETPAWRELKRATVTNLVRAHKTTPGGDDFARGLVVATMVLQDLRLEQFETPSPKRVAKTLRAGLRAAKGPAQRAALWRALAELRLSDPDRGDAAVLEAIKAWEQEGGVTWLTHLARCRAAARAGDRERLLDAIRLGELSCYTEGVPPWARFEFYALRATSSEDPGPSKVALAEAVLAAKAPPSFKALCAKSLASSLLESGEAERAAEVLDAHPLDPTAPAAFRHQVWFLRASAALGCGDAPGILALLDAAPESKNVAYLSTLLRACAQVLLGEGELANQTLEGLALADGQRTPAIAILELQTAVLSGQKPQALQVVAQLVERGDGYLLLHALEALEALLELRREGRPLLSDLQLSREVGAAINEALLPKRHRLGKSLIRNGRWESAIELELRLLGSDDPPAENDRALRICYRALRRGLEAYPPQAPTWRNASRHVKALVTKVEFTQPGPIVDALVTSLRDVSPGRRQRLADFLEVAAKKKGAWEEFSEATVRLRRRSLMESERSARFERRAQVLWAVRDWAEAFSTSPEAYLEYILEEASPNSLEQLQELRKETETQHLLSWRIDTSLFLAQRSKGRMTQKELCQRYLRALGDRRGPLPRARREALLLLLTCLSREDPETPAETRRILDWLLALSGLPEQSQDLRDSLSLCRYQFLRAWALLELGQPEQALAVCERIKLPPQAPLPRRTETELLHARVELRLGRREAAQARLERSVAETPSSMGFRELARCSRGERARAAYSRALAYVVPQAELSSLLAEVEAAGIDPGALVEANLRILEEQEPSAPLRYAKAIYQLGPSQARALLLLEAIRLSHHVGLGLVQAFMREEAELIADAKRRLPEEVRALWSALDALRAARLKRNRATILQAIQRVEEVPVSRALSDRARAPVSLALAYDALALEEPAYLERSEELIRAFEARGSAPFGLSAWVAGSYRRKGELQRAEEIVAAGLERLKDAPPAARAGHHVQAALTADARGEDERALECVRKTLAATQAPTKITVAKLSESLIWLRQGRLPKAARAIRVAHEFCPPKDYSLVLQAVLFMGRVQLARKDTKAARESLVFAQKHPAFARSSPEIRCLALALEAGLESAADNHSRALTLADEALRVYDRDSFAYRMRLTALAGTGKLTTARKEAADLLEGRILNPGPKAEIKTWLEQAGN